MEEQLQPAGARARQPVKVFIEGHYRKHSRDLPQTVFFCPDCKGHPRRRRGCVRCEGFGKLTRDSVQELIGWVVGAAFKTRKNKFHGAGREDVNVRMLGGGRPFVMEVLAPKVHDVDLAAVEAEINRRNEGRLEVLGLHWTEKTRVRAVKEGKHAKEYRALVAVSGPYDLAGVKALLGKRTPLVQHTPERVAHRRADLDRERWLEFLSVEPAEASPEGVARLEVRLRTQHGTYVKEAISGEGGSTRPSLSGLIGSPCECVELDVTQILDEEGGEEKIAPARPAPSATWASNLED
ncbi:MAG TPA: tRNA pseudouridine(54/55) synthase Pus10 [Planctomycetota bacterium]|nr:tRNA pseudouridine(54/55) synthase Pus10 [Planctomycetota bacterium]